MRLAKTTSNARRAEGRVFIIEPAQEQPRFAGYDPSAADAQWRRTTF
jgi:hypothetical protein